MFGFRIITNKEIIEAIKTVEELKKVNYILRNQVAKKRGLYELVEDYCVSNYESRILNIHRGSYISSILALYKEYTKK